MNRNESGVRDSPESEQIVLGAVLKDQQVLQGLSLEPDDFWNPRHADLFRLMRDADERGGKTDMVSVAQEMIATPIKGVGPADLYTLMSKVAATEEAFYHERILKGLSSLRAVDRLALHLHTEVANAGWDGAGGLLQDARRTLAEVEARSAPGDVMTFADALEDAIAEWTAAESPATPTGWKDLDDYLNGGWRPGQLTIMGARPAVGKSMLAGAAAVQAYRSGVGFFSLEMSATEMVGRMAANKAQILLSHIEQRRMTDADWEKITALQSNPLPGVYLHPKARISTAQVRGVLRDWMRLHPIKLVIIDYLQLMKPVDAGETRERQVSRLAEELKVIAQEFNTHVVALAQVNRGAADRAPVMSDLRESGGIEANADNVILLHQDEDDLGEIQLIVAKNRHGRTGEVKLAWQPHYGAARDLWEPASGGAV